MQMIEVQGVTPKKRVWLP